MKGHDPDSLIRDTNLDTTIEKYLDHITKGKYQPVRNDIIFSKLVPNDLNGKAVLDYGCRNGHFSIQLAKRGAKVTGLDISSPDIDTAKYYAAREGVGDRCSFCVCHKDSRELSDYGAFDFIFLKDVIEHIENDRKFISDIVPHLKAGCDMVVTTPNPLSLGHLFDVAYNRWYLGNKNFVGGWDPTHLRLYSTYQLKKLLREFGLKRRRLHAIGIFPTNLISLLTRFRVKVSNPAILDKILGGIPPFNALGWGQLNSFRKEERV